MALTVAMAIIAADTRLCALKSVLVIFREIAG